ncbi:MAG: sulfite exporter TauE/SafE family protein [Micromonosporaceae bacterium]
MPQLVLIALVGFLANLINNALGMGYGVTSATLLLTAGLAPAVVAASVNFAGTGAALASGLAHWGFGNVNWRVVTRLALPGAAGAFAGATVLSFVATKSATPLIAAVLAILGGFLLLRFTGARPPREVSTEPLRRRFLAPVGLVGGFLNGSTGGGWGPVATPALLASGRLEPRQVIGSVDTAEFLVTLAASIGFLAGLGLTGIPLPVVAALLVGSLLAAPVGAWLCRLVPGPLLGVSVGGLLLTLNARIILSAFGAGEVVFSIAYVAIVAAWVGALAAAVRIVVQDRRAARIQVALDTGD